MVPGPTSTHKAAMASVIFGHDLSQFQNPAAYNFLFCFSTASERHAQPIQVWPSCTDYSASGYYSCNLKTEPPKGLRLCVTGRLGGKYIQARSSFRHAGKPWSGLRAPICDWVGNRLMPSGLHHVSMCQ